MTEYDIDKAFKRIEMELIQSIIDNLDKHRAKETAEGLDWEMWQVKQLKALERYRKENKSKFKDDFKDINKAVKELFLEASERGMDEADTLRDILKGNVKNAEGVNNDKVDALIKATTSDLKKAEQAILRKANDDYRKIIYNAQVYASQGGTYEKAVDMATKDFLRRGINSVVYKNGSRHTISDYASMAIRTGSKRAYLMGLGEQMKRWGVHTIRINRRSGACPLCAKWVGRVMIDDVYSGGTKAEAKKKGLPLLSEAMEQGLYHPNCKDVHSMYIEGVSPPEKKPTKRDIIRMVDVYNREQEERHAQRMADSYRRLADCTLGTEQKDQYEALNDKWQGKANKGTFIKGDPMTFEQADGNKVNPKYGEDKVYGANCQSCVPAYEARRRGYDVTARPYDSAEQERVGRNVAMAWRDPKTKWYPLPKRCKCTNHDEMVEYIKNTVGDNTRWQYEFRMGDGGMHTIVVEKENGALILYDPQNGLVVNESGIRKYLEKTDVTYTETWEDGKTVDRSPKLFRIDNLEFDQRAMKWLMQQS